MELNCDISGELSLTTKRALFKLAVDLVKADNRIHSNEIAFLDSLQRELDLPQEEMDMIHYMSMQSAVACLSVLSAKYRGYVVDFLSGIMKADSDIDFEESILLSAVEMALDDRSSSWSRIVSAPDCQTDVLSRQVIYLEKTFCRAPHDVLDDKYDYLLVSKALSDIGLDFFYLPGVLQDIEESPVQGESRFGLLQRSMEYLIPAGDKGRILNLKEELRSLDLPSFCNVVLSRHGMQSDDIPFDAFLLVKLHDGSLLDDESDRHKVVDFLCIDISQRVKERILTFVSKLDTKSNLISYEGYYKILYDYLSSESKVASRIVLDSSYEFYLMDLGNKRVVFESSPQARTLYVLLLKYSLTGVRQECFNQAIEFLDALDFSVFAPEGVLDINAFKQMLLDVSKPHTDLIYNALTIYGEISTKDVLCPQYLGYISSLLRHRSSLKNYINNGFSSVEKLSSPGRYCIRFDKDIKAYSIQTSLSSFFFQTLDGEVIPLTESNLWKQLK